MIYIWFSCKMTHYFSEIGRFLSQKKGFHDLSAKLVHKKFQWYIFEFWTFWIQLFQMGENSGWVSKFRNSCSLASLVAGTFFEHVSPASVPWQLLHELWKWDPSLPPYNTKKFNDFFDGFFNVKWIYIKNIYI